jgi:hypothetical protein
MLYQFQICYVFIDVFMLMDTLCATINVCVPECLYPVSLIEIWKNVKM